MPHLVDINEQAPYGKTAAEIDAAVVARSHAIWGQTGRVVAPPNPLGHVLVWAGKASMALAVAAVLTFIGASTFLDDETIAGLMQRLPFATSLPAGVELASVPYFALVAIGAILMLSAGALTTQGRRMLRTAPQGLTKRAVSTRNVGRRRRLWLTAILLGTAGAALFARPFLKMGQELIMRDYFLYDFPLACLGLLMVITSLYVGKRAYILGLPSASELQAKDPRPPVVLLRSFHDEDLQIATESTGSKGERKTTFVRMEEAVSDQFAPFGPLVAIGRPGEALPTQGAARNYHTDAEWKDAVAKWMDEAQILLVIPGLTPGLGWELEAIERRGHIGKLLVLMPPSVGGFAAWYRSRMILGDVIGALAKIGIVPDAAAAAEKDRQQRWDILRKAMTNVPAFADLPATVPEGLIALHLGPDGKPTCVLGPHTAEEAEYERAIGVAVYGMFCQA